MQETTSIVPRLVVAAPQGRSGKTTLTLGVCAALSRRGLQVQPFKKGPDFIDPSWLSAAAGRACRSLDPYFLEADTVQHGKQRLRVALFRGSRDADVTVIEGNHGLYDDSHGDGAGSTAAVARALGAPVLLVINAARMARSAAAMVLGYVQFEPDTHIAGVILNNVAHPRHAASLSRAIRNSCDIPVVGALPRAANLSIPDRHLGLVPPGEDEALMPAIEACRQAVEQNVALDTILEIARQAGALHLSSESRPPQPPTPKEAGLASIVIGVFRDQAFSFYYPENLEALQYAGADLVFIDSLNEPHLPAVDGLYIGGGFPEVFMEKLEANGSLRREVHRAAQAGLPVYAECGGLMYLARAIHWQNRPAGLPGQTHRTSAQMAGVLPVDVALYDRPQGHGYVLAETRWKNPLFPAGSRLRGHEFHHSRLVDLDPHLPAAYHLTKGKGLGDGRDGLVYRNVLASYTHLHAHGAPDWAACFVAAARGSSGPGAWE